MNRDQLSSLLYLCSLLRPELFLKINTREGVWGVDIVGIVEYSFIVSGRRWVRLVVHVYFNSYMKFQIPPIP
jgi:hypothetical protein